MISYFGHEINGKHNFVPEIAILILDTKPT